MPTLAAVAVAAAAAVAFRCVSLAANGLVIAFTTFMRSISGHDGAAAADAAVVRYLGVAMNGMEFM